MLEPHLAWAGQTSATSQLAIVWVVQVVWSQLHAGSMKAALENMWATSCSCIPVILLVDTEILISYHFLPYYLYSYRNNSGEEGNFTVLDIWHILEL